MYALGDIREMAHRIWELAEAHPVMAFHGEMGAGKTTLIHALCDVRSVKGAVGSPTFSIINEYVLQGEADESSIFHIDLYRLRDTEEAIQAGVEDCLYSGQTCMVEWPERAPGIFPENTLHIYLEAVSPDQRKLTIKRN